MICPTESMPAIMIETFDVALFLLEDIRSESCREILEYRDSFLP